MTSAQSGGVKLAPRSLVQVAARVIALAALAAQLAVAARFLDRVDLGSLIAALAVLGIAGAFSEFGLTNTIVLSLSHGRSPGGVLADSIRASAVLAALALVGATVGALLLLGDDLWAFVCLIPWFLVSRAAIPLIGFAQWQHRFTRIAAADGLGKLSAVVFTLVAWQLGDDWSGEVRLAVVAGGLLVGALIQVALLTDVRVRPTGGGGGWGLIRDALPIGLTNGASFVHSRIDQVVLGAYGYRRALADYGLAYRVVDASLAAALGIATVALPVLGQAEREERAEIGVMLGGLVGVMALTLGTVAFWLAEPIVLILGGEQYRDAASLLRLLSPVLVVSLLNMVPAHLALVHGRANLLFRAAVGFLLVNVALNLVLVPQYQADGAAIASIVTESLGLAVVSWIAARAGGGGVRWSTLGGTVLAFLIVTVAAAGGGEVSPLLGAVIAAAGVALGVAVLAHPVRLLLNDARTGGQVADPDSVPAG